MGSVRGYVVNLSTPTIQRNEWFVNLCNHRDYLIMKHLLILFSILLLSSQAFSQNNQITSFSKSKKLLLKLYKDNPVTLYCGCSFKGKKPNLSSCGYIPKKDKKRANRI